MNNTLEDLTQRHLELHELSINITKELTSTINEIAILQKEKFLNFNVRTDNLDDNLEQLYSIISNLQKQLSMCKKEISITHKQVKKTQKKFINQPKQRRYKTCSNHLCGNELSDSRGPFCSKKCYHLYKDSYQYSYPVSKLLYNRKKYGLWAIAIPDFKPQDYAGFIYHIYDITEDKHYIGKRIIDKNDEWKTYTSSSEELKAALTFRGLEDFNFTIIDLALTSRELSRLETKILQEAAQSNLPMNSFYNKKFF